VVTLLTGRAIAQAVMRRLPTATARVRTQVRSCGICGGQSGTGAGFLRVLRFPLPIRIPPIAPQSSCIIRGWHNRPNSGRSTSHPMREKNFLTCMQEVTGSDLCRKPAILTEIFRVFPHFFQADSEIVLLTRPRPLPHAFQ
jgi:hypothetical protein